MDNLNETKNAIEISLTVVVDETVSKEDIAKALEEALRPLKPKVDSFSDVVVRTVSREPICNDEGGYRTAYAARQWGKATCM